MYFVRSSTEGSQEAISSILTIIWRIAPSVNGIVFKDLKQTLRKEQCEVSGVTCSLSEKVYLERTKFIIIKPSLLITANVPSAKNLIVHGPDLSQIPNQFPIYDNTQFSYIIQESFGFFKIPESKKERYHLFDIKTSNFGSKYFFLFVYKIKLRTKIKKIKSTYRTLMFEISTFFEEIFTHS